MNNIDFDIPHRSCSFGSKELYFSSLAGLAHIAYGTALAVYKLVIYTYSLISQGHFFPRYQTAKEAANDVQPWQHLGYGAILLIPLIGSLFLWAYQAVHERYLEEKYFWLAHHLQQDRDTRHQLILDLYTLSYTHRSAWSGDYILGWNPDRNMNSSDIFDLCFKLELQEYAPELTLFLIKEFNRFPIHGRENTLYCFERCVVFLEKLKEAGFDIHNNPILQEAVNLTQQLDTRLAILRPSRYLDFRVNFAFTHARFLEVCSTSPQEIRTAFLAAGDLYATYIDELSTRNSYIGDEILEKAAICFEKGGDSIRAEEYRQRKHQTSSNQNNPAVSLSPELKQQTNNLIALIAQGGNQRAAFVEFINQFPDDPANIDALQQHLNRVKLRIKNAKRHFQRNCHPDHLAHAPNYVESLKSQRICAFFLQAAR